jgi:hypothetical protein
MRQRSAIAVLTLGLCLSALCLAPPGGAAVSRTLTTVNAPTLRATQAPTPPQGEATATLRADLALPACLAAPPSAEAASAPVWGPPVPANRHTAPVLPVLHPPRAAFL